MVHFFWNQESVRKRGSKRGQQQEEKSSLKKKAIHETIHSLMRREGAEGET